ncbi:MAG: hypothetical protein GXC73_14715 [Chitinophagaceae bacterium]|nr:hypothetical protein [Chitinophagaceae bacterium]
MQKLKSNIWWLSFIATFGAGFLIILAYCFFKDSYTLKSITLPDWLNYFAACGTVGGFLYLIMDKLLSDKEANHLKWQCEIPFVTLASPCDPTLNYCDINILGNTSSVQGRGDEYFSVCNLGKINAYDISILFSTEESFSESKIFNRHYINHIAPLKVFIGSNSYFDYRTANNQTLPIPMFGQVTYYEFKESIYSNYNVDPATKQISNTKFDLCDCISNCNISPNSTTEKYFFVKIIYHSSFSKKHRYRIISEFKVHVICSKLMSVDLETNHHANDNEIRIKGITLFNYEYNFVDS